MVKVRKMFRESDKGFVEVSVDNDTFNKLTGAKGVEQLEYIPRGDVNGGGLYDFDVDGVKVYVKKNKIKSESGKETWKSQPIMKIEDAKKYFCPLEAEEKIDLGTFA